MGLKFILVLSPFLYNGFILEHFNQEGKIPEESDLLNMNVSRNMKKRVLTFRIFVWISTYWWALFDFSDLIIFSISLVV